MRWLTDYRLEGAAELELQHFYRAMAWLGTPLPEAEQDGATPFSPRCLKDLLEEELFSRRRGLFTDLDLVFFDTTSIYFEGKGGDSLGRHGYSKDHRPDLSQLVVGMVLDNSGYPVCAEIWPGNTADASSILPVAERLRKRFRIRKVCLVADRGMVSADTRKTLESMGWFYILGARMHSSREVGEEVIPDESPFREVVGERQKSKDPAPLKVKEVLAGGSRYVVCLNAEEARKDRRDREAIVAGLEDALKRGDKSLVGNKGCRRHLSSDKSRHFSVDRDKVEAEKAFDGKWVLVTNTAFPAEEVAERYKQLIQVEDIFRQTKSLLETRPIFHKRDETIRGHVWCSFLALTLRKELRARLEKSRKEDEEPLEWAGIMAALESLGEAEITSGGKRYLWRSEAKKEAVRAFAACGMALPPVIRQIV
jgi:transposase